LEALIAQSVLRAPADGILYQFDLKDGAYIQAADQLGYLADLTKLRLKAYVDEPDLGKITPGAEVIITWNAHPEKRWKAKVSYIPFHVAAHGTRSVGDVYCPIDDPGPALIPNIHVDVEISMAQVLHVAALPRNTVFSEGKSHYVWAPRGEQARKVAVQVGRSTPALMEITKGLLLGDKVIVPEDVPITEGMKIRIVEDKAANERS
jgi:multidrug efflux pump subunit AcrA (membrane-fusion protein)